MPLRPDVMRRIWIVSFLGVTVSGCVSSASEAVRTVRYTDDVKACTRLAAVESTSLWGGAGGRESNKATMRRETASRGGDTLLIISETGILIPHSVGEAYRCGQIVK
jgi:hypothetical protein